MLSAKLVQFYCSMHPPENLPPEVEVLFPQQHPDVQRIIHQFFSTFYHDNKKTRRLIFGINPGRFGAGITGINFTAPKQLRACCGIDHPFKESSELSAEFIYEMITAYGGTKKFYSHFFLTAISPLGYIKNGKNINYYDDIVLKNAITPFAVQCIQQQITLGCKTDICFCIGEDKNYKFLSLLNEKHRWFREVIPLPHPRFIMQYRRSYKHKYIQLYIDALKR